MLCNHPLCRASCQTSLISYIPGWLGDGTYIYTDYAVRWLALSKRSCSIHILITRELKAQQMKLCTIRWKFPQLSWGICINIGPFTVQYSAWSKWWIQVKCIQSQSSFSLLPCKHSQMHEKREQLKIDCTCMDVTLYKPLNPGQPNLYHVHLLGSVGGWSWLCTVLQSKRANF